jgi:uncharacterized protein YaiI (UPF0178 family)
VSLTAVGLSLHRNQGFPLVLKLDVDDLDRWENRLLVCVAGPRYQPTTRSAITGHPVSSISFINAVSSGCTALGAQSHQRKLIQEPKRGYSLLHIYVDADACPVKQEVYRVAKRYGLSVTLVAASWMRIPESSWLTLKVVGDGLDTADDWIIEHVETDDIVITGDVCLAARSLEKGACAVGHKGKPFTDDNIGPALATRDLLSELRMMGEAWGGPPPFAKRDRSRFLQQLDEAINTIRRKHE